MPACLHSGVLVDQIPLSAGVLLCPSALQIAVRTESPPFSVFLDPAQLFTVLITGLFSCRIGAVLEFEPPALIIAFPGSLCIVFGRAAVRNILSKVRCRRVLCAAGTAGIVGIIGSTACPADCMKCSVLKVDLVISRCQTGQQDRVIARRAVWRIFTGELQAPVQYIRGICSRKSFVEDCVLRNRISDCDILIHCFYAERSFFNLKGECLASSLVVLSGFRMNFHRVDSGIHRRFC